MKREARQCIPAKISESLFPHRENPSSDPTASRKANHRRARSVTSLRLRRDVPGSRSWLARGAGRRSAGPVTPLLTWKFDVDNGRDGGGKKTKKPETGENADGGGRKKGNGERKTQIASARRLGAGLWQMQPVEVSLSGPEACRSIHRPTGLEAVVGHLGTSFFHDPDSFKCQEETKDHQLQGPCLIPHKMNNFCGKLKSSVTFPNPAMEHATKWDPGSLKTSDEVHRWYSQLRFLGDQRESTSSIFSILQSELEEARARVHELEVERISSKKKIDHFLRKLAEENAAWRRREHEKVRFIIDGVKEDLNRERKHRQRTEIMNTRLVNELAEAKLTTKRFMQDYEKERKSRELIEEVCDELAKEIGEEKAEVETLKAESMRIREEVEEERKMLQMAEVWREERVQMKLVDAKLTLEHKYSQLAKMQAKLDAFVRSKTSLDPEDLKEAEILKNAARSINIEDIKEFSYQPPTSEDIFSAFEDLHSGEANEKDMEKCFGYKPDSGCYSPVSRSSKVHTVSPEVGGLNENHFHGYAGAIHENGTLEEDGSVWDSGSQGEEQGSSNSLDGSDPSVNGHHEESNISSSGTDWEEDPENICLAQDADVAYSAQGKQSEKKPSTVSRLWRSFPKNGDSFKTIPAEMTKGRISSKVLSPDRASKDGALSPQSVSHCISPDAGNPHITRGMKGCIEWPRGIQKNCLKAKLLEARIESQKVQLRQALKQKI